MTNVQPAAPACVAVLLAVGLTACSSDSDSDGVPSDQPAALTTPGAELALGTPATVPLEDDAGVVELTVASIDQGVTDPDRLAGTAYYVRLDATVVSGDGYQFFAEQYLTAWAGSERIMPLAAPALVGDCTRAYFELDPPVGASIQPCLTFVVPEGSDPIDRVGFYAVDDYRIDDDTIVEWS